MFKRRDYDYLQDILEAFNRLEDYITGLSYEKFWQDTKTQDAVIRNIEVIGEAVKNLSTPLKNAHPEIPWKDMAGARDKLIHQSLLQNKWEQAIDVSPRAFSRP